MADQETEEWAKKSKRIEAERMKAVKALAEEKTDKTNLAFLDPSTKVKGWSSDLDVIFARAERMSNVSILFAVLGVVFGLFSSVFGVVAEVNNLGLAGAGISIVIGVVKVIGIGVGVLTGLVALICTLVIARRAKRKVKHIIIASCFSLGLIAVYYLVLYLVNHL